MWKLGLWPRNLFSGNICFEFSVLCLCSVAFVETMSRLLADSPFGKVNRNFLLQALEAEYRGQVEEMKKRLTASKAQMVPGDYPHQTQQGRFICIPWHRKNNPTLQGKSHLCIPFLGIVRPQSQFPHWCVCERFIYSQDRSTYFPIAE